MPASASEVAALHRRLAELEATLAEVRATAPVPRPSRDPIVLVGPSGSGKTSLALRLGRRPEVVGARRPAALIVAPETGTVPDAAPLFWAAGVPVAVVATADDVREALRTFAEADLLLVDTPSLPLAPERARPAVARLGAVLAPLGTAEVHLVVDATRSAATLTALTVAQTRLRPDVLSLTRLDEAPGTDEAWADALRLPLRLVAAGPDAEDLAPHAPPARPSPSSATPAPFLKVPPSATADDLTWLRLDDIAAPAPPSASVHA